MSMHPFAGANADFHTQLGTELLEWRDGFVRVGVTLTPQHLNRSGIVHGGVLLSILDEVGAMCGLWPGVPGRRRNSVTVDLAGHFTGRAREGRIIGIGELASHGKSLYFARGDIRDQGGALLAFGTSTHRWQRGSGPAEMISDQAVQTGDDPE